MLSLTAQYAALGASAAILAALILAAHLFPRRVSFAAHALLRAWNSSPRMFAPPLIAVLLLASGASLWMAAQETLIPRPIASAILTPTATGTAPDSAPPAAGQIGIASSDNDASRDKAIEALRNYANKIDGKVQTIASIGDEPSALPDVDTMITQLASRLEQAPDDVAGWRMLGWSYANTGDFANAAKAYEAALTRDPKNAEIQAALNSVRSKTAPSSPAPTAPHAD